MDFYAQTFDSYVLYGWSFIYYAHTCFLCILMYNIMLEVWFFIHNCFELALDGGYRLPPQEIRDIVDAPPLPALSFSPKRDKILFLKRRSLPPISDLARPEEKLAGIRIDAKCNTRSRMWVPMEFGFSN